MSRRAFIVMLAILAGLALGSVYLNRLYQRLRAEARPRAEATVRTRLREAALQSPSAQTETVTLYFPSYSEGKLIAEKRQIAWANADTDRIHQVLLALIEGPQAGENSPLPASADIRAVFLTDTGTAYLDFSGTLLNDFTPGIESETLAVYSIVDSIAANIPQVNRVRILIQGQEVDSLDGHAELNEDFVPDSFTRPVTSPRP